ncbi:class I SAM-dependent methyltransferase [Paraflavisolibacter sp. H34]|uniref:O-methyltransferase n=1 Tax=Huijunlia imazamoxiresistens TaxID=3127457 RepID=UPI003018B132
MHSPFVFDFILNVLNGREKYPLPTAIDSLRSALLRDHRPLDIVDLGAGSRVHTPGRKTVRQLAKTAVKPRKYGSLLYRLVKHYQPLNIIELGTSLGVTTASLALANPLAHVATIEGSPQVAGIAAENFRRLHLSNIRSLEGNFDHLLPPLLQEVPSLDLGFVDGNHRLRPTLDYFHQMLAHVHNSSILVFDDIHWSAEMEQAWEQIKQHPAVRYTVDVFFLGFVFFRSEFREKQHFVIRY